MKRALTSFAITIVLTAGLAAEVPPTPGPQDIPQPVPGDMGLAGEGRPDITRFLNVRTASSPSLSPGGESVAFATDITGRRQLWVVDSVGGWPRQLTFGDDGIRFHQWSPRGDWIVYGADRGGDEREAFYLISPDGSRERELLSPSRKFRVFGGFSPDGSRIAYATTSEGGASFDIHIVEVDSGTDRRALAGRLGLYVSSWSPDGKRLLLSETRGEDANDLHLLDLESGKLETLFRPQEAAAYQSFAWIPDGSGFYLVTDQGREFAALARYDLGARKLSFVETPENDVESVSLDRDGRLMVWTTNEGGYSALRARDLVTGDVVPAPRLPLGIYTVARAKRSAEVAVAVRGPQVPGDVWLWDPAAAAGRRLTASALAGLTAESFAVPVHLSFAARDGVALHGLLYLPAARPGTTGDELPPVLLAVHGGPTGQARPRFNAAHQYLLARGIAVFDLNFRGSTGYGKTFSRLDNGRLRPNAVRDMADALDFLAADGRVDAQRAAVMGGSYGGYMTFAAVTELPDRFAAAVSFVGVSNWVTALEGASPQLKASDRIEYGNIDDPEDREFFRQISPITHVDRVVTPLMVVHGANDPRDPVTESDQFVRAVRERGGRVEYLRFPDEGHSIRKLSNRIITYRRVAAFLERELGVAAPEVTRTLPGR